MLRRRRHAKLTRFKSKTSLIAASALLPACLAVATGAWHAAGRAEPPGSSASEGISPAAFQATAPPAVPQTLRITIRPTGFDPAEVTIPQGRFILAVDNRSGLRDLTFRLDRESGGRLHEVRMPRESLSWRALIDASPGTYTLTEANHPEWLCRVTVTP
jgi:hypothetical protein